MSMTQESAIPLYEEVVNGFNKLSADIPGRESSDLRRVRQSAFERFRQLGFPTIRNEDWKYTNITRFLKDEYTLGDAGNGWTGDSKGLVDAATIVTLDCYQVVLVNGSWNGDIKGGPLPKGIDRKAHV